MSAAIFKKEHLKNYQVVTGPGTFKVKVSNTVLPDYLYDEGDKARYLVNLRCGTTNNFKDCLEIMGNNEIISFDKIRHCFFTGAIWDNELFSIENLPTKGEEVIATFDYVDNILRCISITLIPRKQLENFDLNQHCNNRKLYLKLTKNE